VCDEQDGVWDPIGTHETRREAEGLSGALHVRAGRTGVPHTLVEGGLTRANAIGKRTSCRRDGVA